MSFVIFARDRERAIGPFDEYHQASEILKLLGLLKDKSPYVILELQWPTQWVADELEEIHQRRTPVTNRLDVIYTAILSMIPDKYVIRVREGGGPEDLLASLSLSVKKLSEAVEPE